MIALIHLSKPVLRQKLSTSPIRRSLKFWSRKSKSTDSSSGAAKPEAKLSLAYYSLDPQYLSASKKSPILMYHSLLTSKEMYQNSVKQLAERTGRTVYLLDMRNHGESPHIDADKSDLKAMSKDVIDFMDEFSLKKAVLVGHGIGGLAMLRTSLTDGDRVEKVAAIDMMPIDLIQSGPRHIDRMVFAVSMLPQYMSLPSARLIVKEQMNRYFRDKVLLHYILMNLSQDSDGSFKWRLNLPVIRALMITGTDRTMISDKEYKDEVLIITGKYGSMTANNYEKLKKWFPKSEFQFYQQYKHILHSERQKQFIEVLSRFVGEEQRPKREQKTSEGETTKDK